jgi:hypothetical protein
MSKARRIRQYAQRKEKHQLRHALITQAKANQGEAPIGDFTDLNMSFGDYAIESTKREIKDGTIGTGRTELIEKVIDMKDKLNPKLKNQSHDKVRITMLSSGFETSR